MASNEQDVGTLFSTLVLDTSKATKSLADLDKKFSAHKSRMARFATDNIKHMNAMTNSIDKNSNKIRRDLEKVSNSMTTAFDKGLNNNAVRVIGAVSDQTTILGNAMRRVEDSVNRLNKKLANVKHAVKGTTNETIRWFGKSDSLFATFSKISFKMFLIEQGARQVYSFFHALTAPGLNFARSMETNKVGMAGILSSMTTLKGENLEWNKALAISDSIIKDLNKSAIETAASSEELVGAFRALLAPGLGAGMSIDEIKSLTVTGVNAVKSMGLNSAQVVQELRDLVQGGIQPASSTLATSLGLKDADIKRAKESSEGLFKFLMKRLEGFALASKETTKTIEGMENAIQEGLVASISGAMSPVIKIYRETLEQIMAIMFNADGGYNEEFLETLDDIYTHLGKLFKGLKNIADFLSPVLTPAFKALVSILGVATDHVELLISLGLINFFKNSFVDVRNLTQSIDGSYEATTLLGRGVDSLSKKLGNFQAKAKLAFNSFTSVAEEAAAKLGVAGTPQSGSAQGKQVLRQGLVTMGLKGNTEMAQEIANLKLQYQSMGVSAETAGKLQLQAAQVAATGNVELTKKLMATQTELVKTNSLMSDSKLFDSYKNSILAIGGALTAVGGALSLFSEETGDTLDALGSLSMKAGVVLIAVSQLTDVIKGLGAAVEFLAQKQLVGLLAKLGIVGAVLAVVATLVKIATDKMEAFDEKNDAKLDAAKLAKQLAEDPENAEYLNISEEYDKNKKAIEKELELEKKKAEEEKALKATEEQAEIKRKEQAEKQAEAIAEIKRKEAEELRKAYAEIDYNTQEFVSNITGSQEELDSLYENGNIGMREYYIETIELQRKSLGEQVKALEAKIALAKDEDKILKLKRKEVKLKDELAKKESASLRNLDKDYRHYLETLQEINGEFAKETGINKDGFKFGDASKVADNYNRMLVERKSLEDAITEATLTGDRLKVASLNRLKNTLNVTLAQQELLLSMKQSENSLEDLADRGIISSGQKELAIWANKQKAINKVKKEYKELIAKAKELKKTASSQEEADTYSLMIDEYRKYIDEAVEATHPLVKFFNESVRSSMRDAWVAFADGEKTAKEAISDLQYAIGDLMRKKAAEMLADNITSIFTGGAFKPGGIFGNLGKGSKEEDNEGVLLFKDSIKETNEQLALNQELTAQSLNNKQIELAQDSLDMENSLRKFEIETMLEESRNTELNTIGNLNHKFDALGTSVEKLSVGTKLAGSLGAKENSEKLEGIDKTIQSTAQIATFTGALAMVSGSEGLMKFAQSLQMVLAIMEMYSTMKEFGWFGGMARGGFVRGFAEGGVTGRIAGSGSSTGDGKLIRVSPGEYVVRATAVRALGKNYLDALNNSSARRPSGILPDVRGYATGGMVGGQFSPAETEVTEVTKGSLVFNYYFQSLDPASSANMMKEQMPYIKQEVIGWMRDDVAVRTATKGAVR